MINVQNTEASSDHHTNYTPWDGTFTARVPVAANETKSVYLSSSLPTIYTELLLGQGEEAHAVSERQDAVATNGVTNYNHIRVTDSAALATLTTASEPEQSKAPSTAAGAASRM